MTAKIVECVPNFSEGRDEKKLAQITGVIEEVEGVTLLDVDAGYETNRTVVTFVGSPEAVAEAAFRAIKRASEVIDMSHHQGAHARHGATDVCPFVPVAGVTMEECVALAHALGRRVGEELRIPVYCYDQAAIVPERRSLAVVRAGEYEALPDKLKQARWKPDFGPATFLPKTGVATIGAREFLIAYNINLNSRHQIHAIDLAYDIRDKGRPARRGQNTPFYTSGNLLHYRPSRSEWPCAYTDFDAKSKDELAAHYRGLGRDLDEELRVFGYDPADPKSLEGKEVMKRGLFEECRAVGWVIPEYNRAQISINLTNFKVTSMHDVYEACRRMAFERGLAVTGSEIVGLVPWQAIEESGRYYLEKQGGCRGVPVHDIVETAIQSLGLRDVTEFEPAKAILGLPSITGALAAMRLTDFAEEVSRPSPAPGGGSIAALAGALAASLGSMVANLTHGKKKFRDSWDELEEMAISCQRLKDALLRAVDADTDAFNDVLTAMRMPKDTADEKAVREDAIQAGYKHATSVPLETARLCLETMRVCRRAAEQGLPASVTDAGVGVLMSRASVLGAVYNVKINLGEIKDAAWIASVSGELDEMIAEADRIERETRDLVDARIGAK